MTAGLRRVTTTSGQAFANSLGVVSRPVVRRTPPFPGPAGAIAGSDTTEQEEVGRNPCRASRALRASQAKQKKEKRRLDSQADTTCP